MLPEYQIKANEEFFSKMIQYLNDGGVWGWISEQETFTKVDGKLVGSAVAYNKVRKIVSRKFLTENFVSQ